MFAPTRDQARQFQFETWRKYQAGETLAGLETIALEIILMHPEYHALLSHPQQSVDRDYAPEAGTINPFLHLNLHLAIEEQLSIDHPPGIRAEYERLRTQLGDEHAAKHELIECLGEILWHAQRNAQPPDQTMYLECLRRKPVR